MFSLSADHIIANSTCSLTLATPELTTNTRNSTVNCIESNSLDCRAYSNIQPQHWPLCPLRSMLYCITIYVLNIFSYSTRQCYELIVNYRNNTDVSLGYDVAKCWLHSLEEFWVSRVKLADESFEECFHVRLFSCVAVGADPSRPKVTQLCCGRNVFFLPAILHHTGDRPSTTNFLNFFFCLARFIFVHFWK